MAASISGFILIYRKIQEHWLWENSEPFDKAHAWIDLIFMANFRDKEVLFGGTTVMVKRGQRVTSLRYLADKWNWSRHKVSDFLKALERDNMVTVERDSKKTLITIVNYDIYQNLKEGSGTGSGNKKGTVKGQSRDSKGTERNKVIKGNKEKEKINKKEKEISSSNESDYTDEEALAWFNSIEDETPEEWRQK